MIRSTLVALLVLAPLIGVLLLRGGYVPARFTPFANIDLNQPGHFIVPRDWKIAELRRDVSLCDATLNAAAIEFERVADRPLEQGCGWTNAAKVSSAFGVKMKPLMLNCSVSAALSMWLEHEVQPNAKKIFEQRVVRLLHFGSYACRNIRSTSPSSKRSEHAQANAIDIAAFVLEDGSTVSVLDDWKSNGIKRDFLKAVHKSACGYFRVVLGPEANRLHHNHFHFDRGWLWSCR